MIKLDGTKRASHRVGDTRGKLFAGMIFSVHFPFSVLEDLQSEFGDIDNG